ncbi:hypothetical protein ANCCAN_17447 [Ancylostoma caninum]|uniref:Uncharacterized protein n=1 Tax=Ancylostoma caninum TaxID=29170 RepID=A0A368G103_ANCCA|nr:hypothetical protein ANCCAN_17447 [Ancylostoma caninum]
MDNNDIESVVLSAVMAKNLLEISKEEYLQEGLDESTYEARVEYSRFVMDKVDAASPRVHVASMRYSTPNTLAINNRYHCCNLACNFANLLTLSQ